MTETDSSILSLISGQLLRFMPNTCNICKRVVSDQDTVLKTKSLAQCSRCKITCYCSRDCQEKDWPMHKTTCVAIKYLQNELVWNKDVPYRENIDSQLLMLQKNIGRSTFSHENDLIVYKKRCYTCNRDDVVLKKCDSCHIVSFCETHLGVEHRCDTHLKALQCEQMVYQHGLPPSWLSKKVEKTFEKIPLEWNEYLTWREAPNWIHVIKLLTADTLSVPCTIVYALQTLNLHNKKDVVIHLLGCTFLYEFFSLMKYEEILHVLPGIFNLTIHLVGPELPENLEVRPTPLCQGCSGRKLEFKVSNKLYHDCDLDSPDICFAFNSGLGTFQHDWRKTVDVLILKEIPCIFTCMDQEEVVDDLKFLKSCGGKTTEPILNPFQGTRPFREPYSHEFYYKNQYMYVLHGKNEKNPMIQLLK